MATNVLAMIVLLLSSSITTLNGQGNVPQVMLGSVRVAIGAPAADVLAALRREFWVLDLEDGVGVRSRRGEEGFPSRVAVAVKGERITGVTLTWGPGEDQPSPHDLSRRLALATLGLRGCQTENSVRSVDGTEVSSVRFNCGNYRVFLVTSLAEGHPTAALHVSVHGAVSSK
jgi:hypothetical protein